MDDKEFWTQIVIEAVRNNLSGDAAQQCANYLLVRRNERFPDTPRKRDWGFRYCDKHPNEMTAVEIEELRQQYDGGGIIGHSIYEINQIGEFLKQKGCWKGKPISELTEAEQIERRDYRHNRMLERAKSESKWRHTRNDK
jgi:hypothetical protein